MSVAERAKPLSLVAGIVLAGAGLLSATMTWFTVSLTPGETAQGTIEVTGGAAAPTLTALSIAALALVAALAIAGPFFRVVLAVLEALIGASFIAATAASLSDPIGAAARQVTEATGISGRQSLESTISSINTHAWPVVSILAGVLLIALAALILLSSRLWPGSSRRYETARSADSNEPRSAVADWDSLSDGGDPTGAPEPR